MRAFWMRSFRPTSETDFLLAETHPNPGRSSCSGLLFVWAMAMRQFPTDHPAYSHLTECSPCYREYRGIQQTEPGDVPVTGDYDGDGKTDLAIFRPPSGIWYILPSATSFTAPVVYQWGLPGDVTVSGDYDGDGRTDLAVYRPPTGMWYIRLSTTGYATSVTSQWGLPGDISAPGDYDGDGKTDLAIYRPPSGMWYIRHSITGYTTSAMHQWGLSGDVPVPSDFDGDGKTDLAIFRRPSEIGSS